MEEMLAGGNMNAVVREGDTVLRRAGPWTPTVHRFLRHLDRRGVTVIPRPLDMTADGREVLSYLPGEVPVYPMPDWVWREELLREAGDLLRRLHDGSVDFDGTDAVWQQPKHEPVEVICHNDFSPHNLVFDGGHISGVIDFDTCSPGPRVWDLAYLATRLVPLTEGGGTGTATWDELLRRTSVLLDSYGGSSTIEQVLDVAHTRLLDLGDFSEGKASELDKPELLEHATYYRAEAAWLRHHLEESAAEPGSSSTHIRMARSSDLEHLQRLEDEADALLIGLLQPVEWGSAPTGAARAADPGFILVVFEPPDESPVGFVQVLEIDGQAHLEQLSVPPEHGRRGHGRALIQAAKRAAGQRGYDRLTLRTYADVPWNAPFYRTIGFSESTPDSDFLRGLVDTEAKLGLHRSGARVQMTALLRPS